jgi:putative ABC transport system ATP-binding protein
VSPGAAVRCDGVVHIYSGAGPDGPDVVALRGVDLDVDAGEFVALLGPSGSGKSTVLGLLAGVLQPSAGRVLVGGLDIGRMSPRALGRLRGRLVATVVQNPARNLLPYATARENVRFGTAGRSSRAAADDLLDRLGLAPLAGAVAARLSGGEQQRIAIAAALASGAGLVLADEPTSQLDAAGRDDVVAMLTHDASVAAHCPRTVTIRDGRVGAEGRHGRDYVVVGRDGTMTLPPEMLDQFPPGTLVEFVQRGGDIVLEPRADGDPS